MDIDSILALKSGKCAGLDNIHAKHLKNASNVPIVLLSILFTAMLKLGYCKYDFRNCDYTGYQEQVRGCH